MAKYSGQGWHYQSERHSKARRLGHAGGQYAKHYGRSREWLKGNPKFTRLDMMFKWEEMNPEYMESQMEGIIIELQRPYKDMGYLREKVRNIKSQLNTTIDNFAKRIENPELQKEFIEEIKKQEKEGNLSFNIK